MFVCAVRGGGGLRHGLAWPQREDEDVQPPLAEAAGRSTKEGLAARRHPGGRHQRLPRAQRSNALLPMNS